MSKQTVEERAKLRAEWLQALAKYLDSSNFFASPTRPRNEDDIILIVQKATKESE